MTPTKADYIKKRGEKMESDYKRISDKLKKIRETQSQIRKELEEVRAADRKTVSKLIQNLVKQRK